MSHERRRTGVEGEAAAAEWYEANGFRVVAQNWRCRHGELDLVAEFDRDLVICEVKTRTSTRYGSGAEAVDWRKQRTIRRVTALYLAERTGRAPRSIRFDVAVVVPVAGQWTVEVIEHAF